MLRFLQGIIVYEEGVLGDFLFRGYTRLVSNRPLLVPKGILRLACKLSRSEQRLAPSGAAADDGTNRGLVMPMYRGKYIIVYIHFFSIFRLTLCSALLFNLLFTIYTILTSMAPPHTSQHRKTDRQEGTPRTKAKFFYAIDHRPGGATKKSIFTQFGSKRICERWLAQRRELSSSPAAQRFGEKRPGPNEKISQETLNMLLNNDENPVIDMSLERQIAFHNLGVCERTLQRSLRLHTKNARMYKKILVKDLT